MYILPADLTVDDTAWYQMDVRKKNFDTINKNAYIYNVGNTCWTGLLPFLLFEIRSISNSLSPSLLMASISHSVITGGNFTSYEHRQIYVGGNKSTSSLLRIKFVSD